MVTSPSTSMIGKCANNKSRAASQKPSSVNARASAVSTAASATPKAPPIKAPARTPTMPGHRRQTARNTYQEATAAKPIVKALTPSTVMPPNWKRRAWSSRATRMDGKAAQPRRTPARPFIIKWALDSPTGTWMREATKKAAERIPTAARRSYSSLRKPRAVPVRVRTAPTPNMAGERTPSAICIIFPLRQRTDPLPC